MRPNVVSISESLIARDTVFRWVLSGTLPSNSNTGRALGLVSHQLVPSNDILEELMYKI